MATLTFSLTSSAITGNKSYTLSDDDVNRWLAALRDHAVKQDIQAPPPTNAQLLVSWANTVVQQAKDATRSHEISVAVANISPIAAS
jgi:hypothetical protein